MRITYNSEVINFMNRCHQNITGNDYNRFLDVDLVKSGYEVVVNALKESGYPEFNGKKESWPSLYLSSHDFEETAFHKNIHFEDIKEKDVSFEWINLAAHQLFNLSGIQADPNRELKDWIKFRALDQDLKTLSLNLNNEVWMLDVPSEAATIDPCALKAHGNVCAFGLGIGYFIYMALLNENVKSITVIERNKRVIELFKKYILPQFKTKIDIKIIEGDAFDYFNESFLKDFDYTFVDIYQSNHDGLEIEMALLEKYNPRFETCDFWIENSILEIMPALIYVYFNTVMKKQRIQHPDSTYFKILNKIDKVFGAMDVDITEVSQMKDLMYDHKLHRQILSTFVNET